MHFIYTNILRGGSEWTLLQRSRCVRCNTVIKRRVLNVLGMAMKATDVCSVLQRSISWQECYSERSSGVWRVEPWSKVSVGAAVVYAVLSL